MTWLLTGGAGYIGAHVAHALSSAQRRCVVVDDLSTGVADRLPIDVPLVVASVLDVRGVGHVMERHRVTGLLVVDGAGQLVGAINSNDLMRAKVI